ncbi:hypothetical protein [Blastococcus mobilis]|uniref:Uncharacterized protein n=1 Tax=Blastococcus mobilis TaxID=1938746 RepID=A0A238Z7A1_9ACTN|nr:hypothetical protein [Blastococcus mobilis]SNR78878.1 hypothetical protein SAMN06272737_12572 [Blastococcus mobilis]
MSERKGSTPVGTGTAEIPVVRPADAGAASSVPPAPTTEQVGTTAAEQTAPPGGDHGSGVQATAPVTSRPAPRAPRMPRRGPITVMGPWAPVAGGLLGLLLGVVAVLLLAGTAESFEDRLALVFTVLGLGMLGSAGILLADEVRMMRQRSRDAVARPAYVEATAGLLNGLTPARLLLLLSGFVLFLAAYVSR